MHQSHLGARDFGGGHLPSIGDPDAGAGVDEQVREGLDAGLLENVRRGHLHRAAIDQRIRGGQAGGSARARAGACDGIGVCREHGRRRDGRVVGSRHV